MKIIELFKKTETPTQGRGADRIVGFKNSTRGSSILEVLIASAVLTLSISASAMLIFSNQSVVLDSDAATDALYKAKKVLEDVRADSKENFNTLTDTTYTQEGIYTKKLDVEYYPCLVQAKAEVTWSTETLRPQYSSITSNFVDTAEAYRQGGDCDGTPVTEWDNPITAFSTGIGGSGATDIDANNSYVYLSSNPSPVAKEDFYVYEFDPVAVSLPNGVGIDVSSGLMTIDYANGYVFAGNEDTANQILVLNVNIPLAPTVTDTISLPDAPNGVVRSLKYYDGKLYTGTQYLACPGVCASIQNNEFHIFSEISPGNMSWDGRYNVNHNINDMAVRGNYAYLATSDDTGELHIYNISNPASIQFVRKIDLTGNEDGLTLYLSGNRLFLGRERTPSARKDFYIFTLTDPENPVEWGSINLGLNPGTTVEEIIVKGSLAFIGVDNPTSGLKILNISSLPIVSHPTCTTLNFSENTSAMDMWSNFLFTANKSNDEIRIIQDQLSICS